MGEMRRRVLGASLLLLGSLGLGACSRGGLPPEQVQAWVGRPAADLVKSWGAPTREVVDAGQRVLIYEEMEKNATLNFERTVTARQVGGGAAAAEANASALGPRVYARSYVFWIDAAGAIVRAQIRTP
jgi:hypothetical protein